MLRAASDRAKVRACPSKRDRSARHAAGALGDTTTEGARGVLRAASDRAKVRACPSKRDRSARHAAGA
ncbi:MAG: hypothetical protein R6V57_14065, partial [Vicinamibacterales bacterium]